MRAEGLLVFGVTLEEARTTPATAEQFFSSVLERLRGLPGVQSATITGIRLGAQGSNNAGVSLDGGPVAPQQSVRWNRVGPDYLATFGIPLLRGRDITASDTSSAPRVVLVNETFARRYFPYQDAIGHEISVGASPNRSRIVGIASDSKYIDVREEPRPMAYFPFGQVPISVRTMHFAIRAAADPSALWRSIYQAMREIAPTLPLSQPITQTGQFATTYGRERLFARLAFFFGLLAAILIGTGVYGTLAYAVSRRTPEIGIRMVLGAQRGEVVRMVVGETFVVCALGILLGVPAAIMAARVLEAQLYGVTPRDPASFVAAVAGVVFVALIASLIPARRAASIDPAIALRSE
jgi:predicted permease